MKPLLIFMLYFRSILSYTFEKTPEESNWGIEGESYQLDCQVDESWQWCYWQVLRSFDGAEYKYATVRDHPSNEDLYEGIEFSISQTGCGLYIQALDYKVHDGLWKCHIADTDRNVSDSKVEATASLHVARKSNVDFTVQFPETHLLHETVKLNCAGSEDVKPEPNVQLWIGFENQQHRSLANSTFQLSFDYELEFDNDGGYFYCITEQSGGSGIYFQDKESSDFINLVYGPILDVENHMDYVFVNESITLPITFFAKPMPRIEDGITWQILNRDVIQIMQAGDEEEMYIASDIEVLGSNRYLASLNVQNIENDVNVSVIIKNDLDSLRQDFHVKFQPPLEIIDDITGAKIPYWIFVVVGLVIIFLVLCALVVFCSTKSTRQQKKDDQHKAYLRRYLGEVAREAKPNKHIVNLDDVPEQSLPMLSNANISSPQDNFSNVTMTSGNDASNEASDNDDTLSYEEKSKSLPKVFVQTSKFSTFTKTEYEHGLLKSSFKPDQVHLSLRRPQAPTLSPIQTSRSTSSMLRLGGITQYPVMSPSPAHFDPASLPPGRKTSFINYANPKEL